ncbi:MAG: hypothetical protein JNK82_09755 [Myxococcaceae bacterium]|nr:hypothetical protein [Myxococcaceae bacterium]
MSHRACWLLLTLALVACNPWRSMHGSPDALRGKRTFTVLPIDFETVVVDGRPVRDFLATEGPGWRKTWAPTMSDASTEFRSVVKDKLRAARLEYDEQGGGDVTVKPTAVDLQTGGFRPLVLYLVVDAVDTNGALLEQIELRTAFDQLFIEFEQRMRFTARDAGAGVAAWLIHGSKG